MKTVMAFGTFDGLHEGHRYFLGEAKKLGEWLVVSVAHDRAVRTLKNREPRHTMEERAEAIRSEGLADEVVIGDAEQGKWTALKRIKPDIIALGHDQDELGKSLQILQVETVVIGKK